MWLLHKTEFYVGSGPTPWTCEEYYMIFLNVSQDTFFFKPEKAAAQWPLKSLQWMEKEDFLLIEKWHIFLS